MKRVERVGRSWVWRSDFWFVSRKERSKSGYWSMSWPTRLARIILEPVSGSLLSVWRAQKKLRVIVEGKDARELTSKAQAKEMGEYLFDVSRLPLTNKTPA